MKNQTPAFLETLLPSILETKRKSTSRNPYTSEDNSIRSAILRIAYTNFLIEHALTITYV